jgi:hypothetical protein
MKLILDRTIGNVRELKELHFSANLRIRSW